MSIANYKLSVFRVFWVSPRELDEYLRQVISLTPLSLFANNDLNDIVQGYL